MEFLFNSQYAYYKVLDIYQIENKTQILLLHFDEKYLNIFKKSNSNIEEQVIEMGKKSFDHKITLKLSEVLNEEDLLFKVKSQSGDEIKLMPFYNIVNEHFSIYLPIDSTENNINIKEVDPSDHI